MTTDWITSSSRSQLAGYDLYYGFSEFPIIFLSKDWFFRWVPNNFQGSETTTQPETYEYNRISQHSYKVGPYYLAINGLCNPNFLALNNGYLVWINPKKSPFLTGDDAHLVLTKVQDHAPSSWPLKWPLLDILWALMAQKNQWRILVKDGWFNFPRHFQETTWRIIPGRT